jgi:hypothetical protein
MLDLGHEGGGDISFKNIILHCCNISFSHNSKFMKLRYVFLTTVKTLESKNFYPKHLKKRGMYFEINNITLNFSLPRFLYVLQIFVKGAVSQDHIFQTF